MKLIDILNEASTWEKLKRHFWWEDKRLTPKDLAARVKAWSNRDLTKWFHAFSYESFKSDTTTQFYVRLMKIELEKRKIPIPTTKQEAEEIKDKYKNDDVPKGPTPKYWVK